MKCPECGEEMRPAPLCFGQYKDSKDCCIVCPHGQECAKELVKRILEGRSVRPSAIIELGGHEEKVGGEP